MDDGSLTVTNGDPITPETQIGMMGETGFTFGCQLYFEIHNVGKPINPEPLMQNTGAPLPHQ